MNFRPARAAQPLGIDEIQALLGAESSDLLDFATPKIEKDRLLLPQPNYVDKAWSESDRNEKVKRNLRRLFGTGRLANTGYLSILPVDQGIEHTAGFSFTKNPDYFLPENIVKLAVEANCNGVASSFGVLGAVAKKYADKIPFIVKINHNELLSYPNKHDQTLYGTVEEAAEMGAVAVGATIYFGSEESRRQITEIAEAFAHAHRLGMATILWCYVRNPHFIVEGLNYEGAADITGQANYLGATIQADIIKQKFPDSTNGFSAVRQSDSEYGKYDEMMYHKLLSSHPIDRVRFQVLNCFAGQVGMLNSGGASSGQGDFADAIKMAVVNKRAGGMGIIAGRKAFERPMDEGIQLLNAIQDVYLCREVTVA